MPPMLSWPLLILGSGSDASAVGLPIVALACWARASDMAEEVRASD
jgi:hypothetical protein